MIPVVGRRMNLLLASSSSSPPLPLAPFSTPVHPMWIHTCSCACCSHRPSSASTSARPILADICSTPFPHRHGIGLESSCRLDSATCSIRGQFINKIFISIDKECEMQSRSRLGSFRLSFTIESNSLRNVRPLAWSFS